jgi:hypothetical protein
MPAELFDTIEDNDTARLHPDSRFLRKVVTAETVIVAPPSKRSEVLFFTIDGRRPSLITLLMDSL